jgi:AraC-like DNA-binding protein
MNRGGRPTASRQGVVIVRSAQLAELEVAELQVRAGASLHPPLRRLQLAEVEALLVLRGTLLSRAGNAAPEKWRPAHALVRRLDVPVSLSAPIATTLLSVRAGFAHALDGLDRAAVPPIRALPGPAADALRHLAVLLGARHSSDTLLLRALGLSAMGWARMALLDWEQEPSPPPWLAAVLAALRDARVAPSLDALASAARVSPAQLARAFRRFQGCTIGEYHRRVRVFQAVQLMQESHAAIATVALSAGFADHAHFTRVFRRVIGMTPRAYRSALHADRARAAAAPRRDPVGRYAFSSRTTHGTPYDGSLMITRGPDGLIGWIETSVMPHVRLDSIAVHGDRVVMTAKVPAGVAVVELAFTGSDFTGEWRLAGRATGIRGRRVR